MGCSCCAACCSDVFPNYDGNNSHVLLNSPESDTFSSHRLTFNINSDELPSKKSLSKNDSLFSFIPNVKIKKTRNGVIGLQITNLLQIINASNTYNDWNEWHFEFCYKFIHKESDKESKNIINEWKSIIFTPDRVTTKGMFYIKIKLYLYDYQIHCRVRAKHNKFVTYFPYSSLLSVNILSSLIESTFDVGEYINFLDENSMYTKEGFVDQILEDSYIQIKCKHNDRKIIKIHSSRVYTAPIYLGFVIDLTDPIDIDKNLLLRNKMNDDNLMIDIFCILNEIYKQYALSNHHENDDIKQSQSEPLRESDAIFQGRFVAKNVIDFLFLPYYKEPKIGCLVRESDGWISTRSYINHCLNRHQKGIRNKTEDVMTANLQELWSYCDICSIEISRYDWICSCSPKDHIMCLFCVNNKIQQNQQLYQLLNQCLKQYLYNDCIQQLVEFVVGRVTHIHEPMI